MPMTVSFVAGMDKNSLSAAAPASEILVKALQQILDDDSFKINSPVTVQARKSAEMLLEWCLRNINDDKLNAFGEQLLQSLKQVILSSRTKSYSHSKEKLWKGFFQLRCSHDFIKQWTDFLVVVDEPVKPLLFQHLTDLIFQVLLHDHFKTIHIDQEVSSEMTENESSALRYVGGYVCRHLRKKLKRESHDLKEEMILCLLELAKDKTVKDQGTSEEWTELIDRGGLCHIKETTFQLFLALEYQVRDVLKSLEKPLPSCKADIIKKVITDDDVQFHWLIATGDFEIDDKETHNALLKMIVELYVTIRGFSKANAWLEKYKQSTKTSTQRTKSLRRELYDDNTGTGN